jgi:glycosyltransferase involved in cell wall biosynthesis
VTGADRRPRLTAVSDSDAWGGAEVYLTHLLRRAEELDWTASVIAAEPVAPVFGGLLSVDRVVVVPLTRHSAAAPALRAALARQRPDVVLVNLVDPGSNAAAVAAALDVAPTVGVLHLDGDSGGGDRRERLAALYHRMAAVLTPSSGGRNQLLEDFGLPPGRVHVVPNGVDIPRDPRGPAGGGVPRVGGLGRLTEQKGFDVLIQAVQLLVARGVALEVVVGGTGRDGLRLREAAAGLPMRFCGPVADVRSFLAGLDVFCLSSRREALPLVLLEAMAEGLPCVATDVGDVRIAVGDGAEVVPAGDAAALAAALEGLLREPCRRQRLAERARRAAVRAFDADRMARTTFAHLDVARGGDRGAAGEG